MPRLKSTNEIAFDSCVRAIGGICLDDLLPGDPKVENADYFFPSDDVIAELKRLTTDPMENPAIKNKIQRLYKSWSNAGLVPRRKTPGVVTFNLRDLPRSCAIEFLGVLKKQLDEDYVKKANYQIKSTKRLLNQPNATGLLLLLNEANFSYEPSVIFNPLFHLFNGGSREAINQLVFFNASMFSTLPNGQRGFYWCQPSLERPDVPERLLALLSQQWLSILRTRHGEINHWIISGPTPDFMDNVKHVGHGT